MNDNNETFSLEVKAANRISRRLRRFLGSAGRGSGGGGIGRRIGSEEPFDPNAYDGDGDGVVQDGSAFERTITAPAQVPQGAIANDEVSQPTNNVVTPTVATRPDGKPRQTGEGDTSLVKPMPSRATRAEQRQADYLDGRKRRSQLASGRASNAERGSLEGLSNKEIAERIVPATEKEFYEASRDAAVGSPSRYKTQALYEEAVAAHRVAYETSKRRKRSQLEALRAVYDDKFGRGALDKDSRQNPRQYEQRVVELLGSQVGFHHARQDRRGRWDTQQGWIRDNDKWGEFVSELVSKAMLPNATTDEQVFAQTVAQLTLAAEANGFTNEFWSVTTQTGFDPTNPASIVSALEFILSELLVPQGVGDPLSLRGGMAPQLRLNEKHTLDGSNTGRVSKEMILKILDDYFDWIAANHSYITRNGRLDGLPTKEQLRARIDLIEKSRYLGGAFGVLFTRPMLFVQNGQARSADESVMNNAASYHPDDIRTLRALVAKALDDNPAWKDAVVMAGSYPISRSHPALSSNLQTENISTPELATNAGGVRQGKLQKVWQRLKDGLELTENRLVRDTSSPTGSRERNELETISLPQVIFNNGENNSGVAGFTQMADATIHLSGSHIDKSIIQGTRIDNETVNTTKPFTDHVGHDGLFIHEWAHGFHFTLIQDLTNELRRVRDEMAETKVQNGMNRQQAERDANLWMKQQRIRAGLVYHIDGNRGMGGSSPSVRDESMDAVWQTILRQSNDRGIRDFSSRDAIPKTRGVFDWDNPQKYGVSTRQELLAQALDVLRRFQDERDLFDKRQSVTKYEQDEIRRIHGLMSNGLLDSISAQQQLEQVKRRAASMRRETNDLARSSDEPYVASDYGNQDMMERWAETMTGVLHKRTAEDGPFYVNNSATRWTARLFGWTRRDGTNEPSVNSNGARHIKETNRNGDLVTVGDRTARRFRRKRRTITDPNEQFEDSTKKVLSTEVIQSPSQARVADGKPEAFSVGARIPEAVKSKLATRFDPDERSRLASGRSNIGLDTDVRLYAFDEPITVSDYRVRGRIHTIGDYRFYDRAIPFGEALTPSLRSTLGYFAGKRYLNRNHPHNGDMVRAISSITFGLFVDDMPTYDTTTEKQKQMLRGLVTGEVTALPLELRALIERAVKDANDIHKVIVHEKPTQKDLYRSINADPERFVSGLVVGERIPMPITAFTYKKPSSEDKVVLRILAGARALDVGDNDLLTQGEFEVVSVERGEDNVVATLRHTAVYDPRHDALRPTDRFDEPPGAHWRKMGSPSPRYTETETQRMTVDMARRIDTNETAVLSSGRANSAMRQRAKSVIENLVGVLDPESSTASRFAEESRRRKDAIEQTKGGMLDFVRETVLKRLSAVEDFITSLYGDKTPWDDDSEIMRKVRSSSGMTTKDMGQRMEERLARASDSYDGSNLFLTSTDPDYLPNGSKSDALLAAAQRMNGNGRFTKRMIKGILEDGKIYLHDFRQPIGERGPSYDDFKRKSIGFIEMDNLDEDERTYLQNLFDAIEALERAYLLNQTVETKDGYVRFYPSLPQESGVSVQYGSSTNDGSRTIWFQISGGIHTSPSKTEFDKNVSEITNHRGDMSSLFRISQQLGNGKFNRNIIIKEHEVSLHHSNMSIPSEAPRNLASMFNQHAFLWMKNINAKASLNVASDGPVVWPRHGFAPERLSSDALEAIAENIENALKFVLTGIDTNNGEDALIDNKILSEMNQEEVEFVLRLATWAAIVRADKVMDNNGNLRPAGALKSIVVLANILPNAMAMSERQKRAWRELYETTLEGGQDLVLGLNRETLDDDYLPAFIIRDEKNKNLTEIAIKTTLDSQKEPEEIARDVFLPEIETQGMPPRANEQQTSRFLSVFRMSGNLARLGGALESSGFDAVPTLLTPSELEEMLKTNRTIKPIAGIAMHSLTSSSRPETREQLLERIRKLLFGERTMGGRGIQFTDAPMFHAHRMVPTQSGFEPATEKSAVIGFLKSWAKTTTPRRMGVASEEISDALSRVFPEDVTKEAANPTSRYFGNHPWLFDVGEVQEAARRLNSAIRETDNDDAIRFLSVVRGLLEQLYTRPDISSTDRIANDIRAALKNIMNSFMNNDNKQRYAVDSSTDQMTLAALLGYDAITKGIKGNSSLGTDMTVLNRGALNLVDTPVSLQDMARITGGTKEGFTGSTAEYAEAIAGSIRNIVVRDNWWQAEAPSLLRLHDSPDPDPMQVSPSRFQSIAFRRELIKDFGVTPPGGFLASGRNFRKRNNMDLGPFEGFRTAAEYEPPKGTDLANMNFDAIRAKALRFRDLVKQVEELEEQLMDLEDAAWEKDWAGKTWETYTRTHRNAIKPQVFDLQEKIDDLKDEMDDISDEFVRDIKTINNMLAQSLHIEGLINGIDRFVRETRGETEFGPPLARGPIPEELLQKLLAIREQLIAEQAENPMRYSLDIASRAAALYYELLNDDIDDMDLRYTIMHEKNRLSDDDGLLDYENYDDDPRLREWLDEHEMDWFRHIWTNLFKREEKNKRRSFFVEDRRRDAEQTERERLIEILNSVFADVTDAQRAEWKRQQDDILNSEFNSQYEDEGVEIPDEFFTSHTPPNGLTIDTWRKVRAVGKLIKKSPFEGERVASREAAKRLLTNAGRPDLANDDFVNALPSGRRTSALKTATFTADTSMGIPTPRGSDPERPLLPQSERFDGLLIAGMKLRGHDISPQDLRPNGRIFKILVAKGWNGADTVVMRSDYQKYYNTTLVQLTDEEVDLIADLLEVATAVSTNQVFAIPMPGHRTKKWQGPIQTSVADVLMDETDMNLVKAQGAPTYETLIDLQAYTLAEIHKLNKAFGAGKGAVAGGEGLSLHMPDALGDNDGALRLFLYTPSEIMGGEGRHHFVWSDVRGREVMRTRVFSGTFESSPDRSIYANNPARLLKFLHYGRERDSEVPGLQNLHVNDVVFDAMCEALGISNPARKGTGNRKGKPADESGRRGILGLRRHLAAAIKSVNDFEFADTDAGRYMKQVFEYEILSLKQRVEIFEKLGQRHAQLIREEVGAGGDIEAYVTQGLYAMKDMGRNNTNRSDYEYQTGSPTVVDVSKVGVAAQSVHGHLRMNLIGRGFPMYADSSLDADNNHEIGHFLLGQAFTRHGEHMANMWQFFVYGPHMWRMASNIEMLQNEFKRMTVHQHFGHKTGRGGQADLTEEQVQRSYQDLLSAVNRLPISAPEKEELLEQIQKDFEAGNLAQLSERTSPGGGKTIDVGLLYSRHIPPPAHIMKWPRDSRKDEKLASGRIVNQQARVESNPYDDPDDFDDGFMGVDDATGGPANKKALRGGLVKARKTSKMAEKHHDDFASTEDNIITPEFLEEASIQEKIHEAIFLDEDGISHNRLAIAVMRYTSGNPRWNAQENIGDNGDINHFLRTGDIDRGGQYTEVIDSLGNEEMSGRERYLKGMLEDIFALDETIEKFGVSRDLTVFRGLGEDIMEIVELLGVGDEFFDKGFVSTSLSEEVVEEIFLPGGFMRRSSRKRGQGPKILRIKLKKGDKALAISQRVAPDGSPLDMFGTTFGIKMGEEEMLLPRGLTFRVTGIDASYIDLEIVDKPRILDSTTPVDKPPTKPVPTQPKSLSSGRNEAGLSNEEIRRITEQTPHIVDKQERLFPIDYKRLEELDPTGNNLDVMETYPDPLAEPIPDEIAETIPVVRFFRPPTPENIRRDPRIVGESNFAPPSEFYSNSPSGVELVQTTARGMSQLDVERSARLDTQLTPTGRLVPRSDITTEFNQGSGFLYRKYLQKFEKLQQRYLQWFADNEGTYSAGDPQARYRTLALRVLRNYGIGGYVDINALARTGELPPERLKTAAHLRGVHEEIETLDSLIASTPPLDEPIQVFRGITNWKQMRAIDEAGVGGVFADDGFMSTSTSPAPLFEEYLDMVGQPPQQPRWNKWHMFSASYRGGKQTTAQLLSRLVNRPSEPPTVEGDARVMPLMRIFVPAGSRGVVVAKPKLTQYAINSGTYQIEVESPEIQQEAEFLLPRQSRFRIVSITDSYVTVELLPQEPPSPVSREQLSRMEADGAQTLSSGRSTKTPQTKLKSLIPAFERRLMDLEAYGVESKTYLWDNMDARQKRVLIGQLQEELQIRERDVDDALEEIERQEAFGTLTPQKQLIRDKEILERASEACRLARSAVTALEYRNDPNFSTKVVVLRNQVDGVIHGLTMYSISNDEIQTDTDLGATSQFGYAAAAPKGRQVFIDFHISLQKIKGVGDALFAQMLMNERSRNLQAIVLEYTIWSAEYWERMGFELMDDDLADHMKLVLPTDRIVRTLKPLPESRGQR